MSSARIRHLNAAPIKEALIDFRVDLPSGINIEAINAVVEVARSAYPIVEPLQTFGAIFDLQEAKVTRVEEDRGFILWDEKRVQAVQFRLDGFTFNRLKPYESWDALHSEAMKWWEIYLDVLKPEALKRTAVKYTNRLLFPDSDFSNYLTRPPARPLGIKGEISFFLYQVRVNTERASAVITQTIEQALENDQIPFILDIDTFIEGNFEISADIIEHQLQNLHDLKNDIFFESLTEEALRFYGTDLLDNISKRKL